MDKHSTRESGMVADTLRNLKTFEHWPQTKFESFSQHFVVERFKKDEVVMENMTDFEKVILVRKGMLRLKKNLTFAKQNIWPIPHNPK